MGSPGVSCAAYAEGTQCPGGPTACVECNVGIYAFSPSNCVCTAGTWDCAGSTATGDIYCSSPVGQYTDPSCSRLYGADAGPDASSDATPEDAPIEGASVEASGDEASKNEAALSDSSALGDAAGNGG